MNTGILLTHVEAVTVTMALDHALKSWRMKQSKAFDDSYKTYCKQRIDELTRLQEKLMQ